MVSGFFFFFKKDNFNLESLQEKKWLRRREINLKETFGYLAKFYLIVLKIINS